MSIWTLLSHLSSFAGVQLTFRTLSTKFGRIFLSSCRIKPWNTRKAKEFAHHGRSNSGHLWKFLFEYNKHPVQGSWHSTVDWSSGSRESTMPNSSQRRCRSNHLDILSGRYERAWDTGNWPARPIRRSFSCSGMWKSSYWSCRMGTSNAR